MRSHDFPLNHTREFTWNFCKGKELEIFFTFLITAGLSVSLRDGSLLNQPKKICFRRMYYEVGRRRMIETLMEKRSNCLLPFFKNCVVENYGLELLKELDKGQLTIICLTTENLHTCYEIVPVFKEA